MMFNAVILAGGSSSRMGKDKALLEVDGQSLLARQIELVRSVGADEVFISGRTGVDYSMFGCRVLTDHFSDVGPLAGIERALDASSSPLLLVLAVDMAAMDSAILGKLVENCASARGAIPKTRSGIEPLAAVYPKLAMDKLKLELRFGKTPGARWLAEECVAVGLARFVELTDEEAECFASANSPDDFHRLTARHFTSSSRKSVPA